MYFVFEEEKCSYHLLIRVSNDHTQTELKVQCPEDPDTTLIIDKDPDPLVSDKVIVEAKPCLGAYPIFEHYNLNLK